MISISVLAAEIEWMHNINKYISFQMLHSSQCNSTKIEFGKTIEVICKSVIIIIMHGI